MHEIQGGLNIFCALSDLLLNILLAGGQSLK